MRSDLESIIVPGHRACPGCGPVLALKFALNALGKNTIVHIATGCMQVSIMGGGGFPGGEFPLLIPAFHTAFETSGAVISGMDAGLKALGKRNGINLVSIAGDGGTADIGLQTISGAVERGHDFIHICYDNEAYMNTGNQRSGTTTLFAATTTTPVGKVTRGESHLYTKLKKDVPAIMAAHGAPYVATASIAYPADIVKKVKKASEIRGPKYIHIHAPCPYGWGFPENKTVEVARLAVQTGCWVLYEIENGKLNVTFKITHKKPVKEYLAIQRRFAHLTEKEIAKIQELVDQNWAKLGST
ncbi:MAG: thiamine pyrophosphate-dependent enzyme [Candidatus Bathyarchaeia archaeon]